MAGDVFEKDPLEPVVELSGDAGDMGPEVPRIIGAAALACGAERLAGVSGEQCVDGACKGSGVKCGEVAPDRGGGEVSGALGGDERAPGVFIPLDETSAVEAGLGEHEAQIEAAAA